MKKNLRRTVCMLLAVAGVLTACGSKGTGQSLQLPQKQNISAEGKHGKGTNAKTEEMEFVSVDRTETAAGVIEIPQFDTNALNSKDTEMANQMFGAMKEELLSSAQECEAEAKEYGDDISEWSKDYLSETRVSLWGNILSVQVRYALLDYGAPTMYFYEAVNIDTSTGKTIPYDELLEAAGFWEQEAESAIYWYGEECRMRSWERRVYFDFGENGSLPDGMGDASSMWEADLEDMLDTLRTQPEPQGKEWDALDRYPTAFFEGPGKLSVCAKVPTEAGAGYVWSMVRVGRTKAEYFDRNPNDCFGNPFGRDAMSAETAGRIISRMLGLDSDGWNREGLQIRLEPLRIENIDAGDGQYEPFYVVQAFLDELDSTSEYGTWAVGVFSGTVLNKERSGRWQPELRNTEGLTDMPVWGDGNIPAIVYRNAGDYERWSMQPCEWWDLTAYYGECDLPAEELLLTAMADDTTVSFEAGMIVDGIFEPQSTFCELELQKGQCLDITLFRQEEMNQRIAVRNQLGTIYYSETGPNIDFDSDMLDIAQFDAEVLGDTCWFGYAETDEETSIRRSLVCYDETGRRDYLIRFEEDGTGSVTERGKTEKFTWKCGSSGYDCDLIFKNGQKKKCSLFYKNFSDMMLFLKGVNDNGVWYYLE